MLQEIMYMRSVKAEIDGTRECLKCYLPTNRGNLEKHGIFIRRKSWTCACHLLSQKEEAYYQYTLMKCRFVLLNARFIFLKLPGLKKR